MIIAAGLCVAAAVAIWGLIAGSFDSTSARVLASALAAAAATLSGLAGATVLGRGGVRQAIGQATIAVSGLALTLSIVLIWDPAAEDSDTLYRALGIALAAMLAGAHAALMYSRQRPGDSRTVRALGHIAVTAASSAALLIGGLLLLAQGPVASPVWRLLGVLVVIAVLTTLLAPIARRIGRTSGSTGVAGTPPKGPPTRKQRRTRTGGPSLMRGRQAAAD